MVIRMMFPTLNQLVEVKPYQSRLFLYCFFHLIISSQVLDPDDYSTNEMKLKKMKRPLKAATKAVTQKICTKIKLNIYNYIVVVCLFVFFLSIQLEMSYYNHLE